MRELVAGAWMDAGPEYSNNRRNARKAMKTILENGLASLAVVITACVVFASGYLWYLRPDRPWPYFLAILVLCIGWILRQLARGDGGANRRSWRARRKLTQAIVSSGLLLAVALGGALFARMG
jgi:hypothetical protein